MKKIVLFPIVALIISFMTSCNLDTDGNNARAETYHFGYVDSIHYFNEGDTMYYKYIVDALHKDSVVSYLFRHQSYVDVPDFNYAIYLCDVEANKDFDAYLKKVSLEAIKRNIFTANYKKDSVYDAIIKDCNSYGDISLGQFDIVISLRNYTGGYAVRKDTLYVR